MGHKGQTNESQKDVFRIGMGTCKLYRERVQKVSHIFFEKLSMFSGPMKRRGPNLKKINREKYQCSNAILTAGGTLIELVFEPQCAISADYHRRKLQWSIAMFIIGDDNFKICYHLAGFPGRSHDNRMWK